MRFIKNQDGTVTDTTTGLTFKDLTSGDVNYESAEELVAALGEGWRVPTVAEVFGLVDHSRHRPAIDTEAFPGIRSDYYWTSTPTDWNSSAVWVVLFYYGDVSNYGRLNHAGVLAVRSSQ